MPTVPADKLERIAHDILIKLGANEEEASTVAEHQIGANLVGHDSHGIILLDTYATRIRKGHIVPGAPIEVLDETPTTARIDGHWGFGQVVSTKAMNMAIEKAKKTMVSAIIVYQQSHVGRVGDYPTMAAKNDLIGFMVCDSGRGPKQVVPYGGREPRLGTNPMCWALPSDLEGTFLSDMATSAAAANKLFVYKNRHKPVPAGWLIDRDGKPTTNAEDYYNGGSLLPLGGPTGGHKGYCLSAIVESFAGILTGLGFGIDPKGIHNDGSLMMCINPAAFRKLDEYKREVAEFARYLKSSAPAEGFTEVLYPGEIEWKTRQERLVNGIPVEDETWDTFVKLAEGVGVPVDIG